MRSSPVLLSHGSSCVGLALVLAAALVPSLTAQVSVQGACPEPELIHPDDLTLAATERQLWREVHRILRLPSQQQASEIVHVYRDVLGALRPRRYPLANWHVWPDGDLDYLRSRAERVGTDPSLYAGAYLNMYAQQDSLALLAAHPNEAQPAIQRDLRSRKLVEVERGAFVAGQLGEGQVPGLYDDLKNVFVHGGACSKTALGQLFRYVGLWGFRVRTGNQAARLSELLPILLARFGLEPEAYAPYLKDLLSIGPAPAELVTALASNDPMRRRSAARALSSSTDPQLAPHVRRMLTDPDRDVRLTGFYMGRAALRRRDAAYKDFALALERLMRDPDLRVQLNVLEDFALARDPICAPVVLDLLRKWAARDASVPDEEWFFSQVAVMAEAVARQKFGFFDGKLAARDDPASRLAIDKFSEWVNAQRR